MNTDYIDKIFDKIESEGGDDIVRELRAERNTYRAMCEDLRVNNYNRDHAETLRRGALETIKTKISDMIEQKAVTIAGELEKREKQYYANRDRDKTGRLLHHNRISDKYAGMTNDELVNIAASYNDPDVFMEYEELNIISRELRSRGQDVPLLDLRSVMKQKNADQEHIAANPETRELYNQFQHYSGHGVGSFEPYGYKGHNIDIIKYVTAEES
jgi:hypothetical protein